MENRIIALEDGLKDHRERSLRFERGYVEARKQFGDKLSDIAKAMLDVGEAIRMVATDLRGVKADTAATTTLVTALRTDLSGHIAAQEARWAHEDVQQGALLAELAALHGKDTAIETAQAGTSEEVTQMRHAAIEQATRAETDRATKTVRTAVATALGGSVVAYLKANPDAFERAWRFVAHALAS